jgi:hypothetical protein
MKNESNNDLSGIDDNLAWHDPEVQAEIALEALQGGNIYQIAHEYKTCPGNVLRLRAILKENARELFLPGIEGDSIFSTLGELSCQIQIMEGVIDKLREILSIRTGSYFSE